MNAQELRIGNFVEKSLKSGNGRSVINAIGCQDIVKIYEGTGSFNYAPIKMTEDIIVKCGFVEIFKSEMHATFYITDLSFYFWYNDGKQYVNFKGAHIDCTYIHELQNIYYCLTGKELSINL